LSKALGDDKVYFPDTANYEDRLQSQWSISAELEPWCIVQPSDPKDVSKVVKKLVKNDCPFGIRSGGHGSFAGSNSVHNGVTVDMGKSIHKIAQ
jgi:FAD/FMN-containing dehydrogenase